MPAALRAAFLQARYKEAGPEYQIRHAAQTAVGLAEAVAENPAHRLHARFDAAGLRVQSTVSGAEAGLVLDRFGCAASPVQVATAAPRKSAAQNRVEYQRPGLTEWFWNGPRGIEQGFTVERDPGCARDGRILFSLKLTGEYHARLDAKAAVAEITLVEPRSGHTLHYADLFAHDSAGKDLASRMRLGADGKTVQLEVDATEARFPVTVDPTLTEDAILTASDGGAGDNFGSAISVSADTAVVGAAQKNQAYVYVRSGSTWTEQAILKPSDGGGSNFAGSVSISGDIVVVGAPAKEKAYVYERSGSSWTEKAILLGPARPEVTNFGAGVSVSGTTLVVGAPLYGDYNNGAVRVYVRSGSTWTLQVQIDFEATLSGVLSFGESVSLDGDTLIVGAPDTWQGVAFQQRGEARIYVRSGSTWTFQAILLPGDYEAFDHIGRSVSISGDTAVIGAPDRDISGMTDQGQAFIYVRSGTTWAEQARLTSSDGAAGDKFGQSVAISGNTVVVGAYFKNIGSAVKQGRAYVYSGSGSTWTEHDILTASDGAAGDQLGRAVGLGGGAALVGANVKRQVYVYAVATGAPNGTPCTLGAACVSGFCADGVCCDTACGGGVDGDCQACSAAKRASGMSGTCGPALNTVVCRMSAGGCDTAATCDGISTTCPPNPIKMSGTTCGATEGCAMPSTCDGSSPMCPASPPKPSGTTCRASTGDCDTAATCDGTSTVCPANPLKLSGTVCRASTGDCDTAATCTGDSGICPANVLKPAGFVCRMSAGDCDTEETCTGSSGVCPANVLKSAGTSCRMSGGVCDIAETCTGSSAACPADTFVGSSTVCRGSAGTCDIAETCTGSSAACPKDTFLGASTVCRASAGGCDMPETCSGSTAQCPADVLKPSGATCGAAPVLPCDVQDTCDGTSAVCADALKTTGTVCKAAGASPICDPADLCDGIRKSCPAKLAAAGTSCGTGMTCSATGQCR